METEEQTQQATDPDSNNSTSGRLLAPVGQRDADQDRGRCFGVTRDDSDDRSDDDAACLAASDNHHRHDNTTCRHPGEPLSIKKSVKLGGVFSIEEVLLYVLGHLLGCFTVTRKSLQCYTPDQIFCS